jgi:catechol 2,3-dioxygenase-like lactoylglutathione lyase family enzyme
MKFICPLITVKNINESRKFYEDILGMKVRFDYGENVTFAGDFSIHLESLFKQLIDNRNISSGGNNFELYFEEDDIDEFYKKLKTAGVDFVHELREQPWRQKVVRFYDPDMHIVEVGESLEHLVRRLHSEGYSIDAICKATYLEEDYVKTVLSNNY